MGTDGLWTLEELGGRVEAALAARPIPQASARVRAVPDRRTIRYYTTLGLLDRPTLRGRSACYGERHLLQLLAIKRLQADGRSLTEVQERLGGLDEGALRRVAALPPPSRAGVAEAPPRAKEPALAPEPASAEREAFWAAAPADVGKAAGPGDADEDGDASEAPPLPQPRPLVGVPLGGDAVLLLGSDRALDPDTLRAIHAAAAPLMQVLIDRGIIDRPPGAARSSP